MFVGNGKKPLSIDHPDSAIPFYWSYGLRCYEYRPQLPETAGNAYYHGAGSHGGNYAYSDDGSSWTADSDSDLEFTIYGNVRFVINKFISEHPIKEVQSRDKKPIMKK